MKRASICRILTTFAVIIFLLSGVASWAGEGAMVVFDNPTCPFRVAFWDDPDSGLAVAMALKEDYASDGECTLDDVIEIFLPGSANKFTPVPFIPDSFKYKGNDVPVRVFEATAEQIEEAYLSGDSDFLDEYEVAYGLVNGQWGGKSYKTLSYYALGTVELIDGGEAMLIGVFHEVYKKGIYSILQRQVDLY